MDDNMKMNFDAYLNVELTADKFVPYNSVIRGSRCVARFPILDPKRLIPDNAEMYFDPYLAVQNAEFYRTAILDETLPAGLDESSSMLTDRSPLFCRYFWIVDLGRIRYRPACPELREVMLHDLRPDLRGAAAEALGKIGDKRYTRDLIHVMQEDKKAGYAALRALGDMQDDSAFPALKERFEEARRRFELAMMAEQGDMLWDQVTEICKMTEIMIRAGGKARQFIDDWGHYEFYDWVRRPMKSGRDYSTIGRVLRPDEA